MSDRGFCGALFYAAVEDGEYKGGSKDDTGVCTIRDLCLSITVLVGGR